MWIKTLKFMMVNRTVTPRDTIIEVDKAQGAALVKKAHAVEVEAPQVAASKPETAVLKAAKKDEIKTKD